MNKNDINEVRAYFGFQPLKPVERGDPLLNRLPEKIHGPSVPLPGSILNRASQDLDQDELVGLSATIATVDEPIRRAMKMLNRVREINLSDVVTDKTGGAVLSSGVGALSGRGSAASLALSYINRSAGTTLLTPGEQRLLERDEAAYNIKKDRRGDQDCGALPMYLPHEGITSKSFLGAVQKYLDQGMEYKAAWLAAKANNPVAFRAYSA